MNKPLLQRATSFAQFQALARQEKSSLSASDVVVAAKQFKVPEADVQALREELLSQAANATDDVAKQTQSLRDGSAGGSFKRQATAKGLGIHALRFDRSDPHAKQSPNDAPGMKGDRARTGDGKLRQVRADQQVARNPTLQQRTPDLVEKLGHISVGELRELFDGASVSEIGRMTSAERSGVLAGHADALDRSDGPSAPETKRASDAPPTGLPEGFDVSTLAPTWGVNIGNDERASATAHLSAADGFQLHLSMPYRGEDAGQAKVGFGVPSERDAALADGGTYTIEMHELAANPELATQVAVALDTLLSKNPGPHGSTSGPGYALTVAAHVARHCADVARGSAPPAAQQREAVHQAAERFSSGEYEGTLKDAQALTESPHPDVRGFANFMVASFQEQLGRFDDALSSASLASVNLHGLAEFHTGQLKARCHRALGNWSETVKAAEAAVDLGQRAVGAGVDLNLGTAWFTLAVAKKNTGDIAGAVDDMTRALEAQPGSTAYTLALAGYQALAGDHDAAQATVGGVEKPREMGLPLVDHNTNAAWFSALMGDEAKVLSYAENAMEAAKAQNFPATVHYFDTESDLAEMRNNAAFATLLDRYR